MFNIETKENVLINEEAKVLSVKKITDQTIEISFQVTGKDFSFKPGQYVWISLRKLLYSDSKGNTRAFSITTPPNKSNTFSIIFFTSPSAYKKTLVKLKKGDKVLVSLPFGSFIPKNNTRKPLVFISGGRAIAPFLSIVRTRAQDKNFKSKTTLVSVNPSEKRRVYANEIEKVQKENKNFNFVSVIGKLENNFLNKIFDKNKNALWYITGPESMVEFTSKYLVSKGVKEENMSFSENYGLRGKTSLEKMKEKIDREDDLYKLAVEDSSDHIVVTDPNGIILYANKSAEKMTGYSFLEMKGQTPRLWGGLMTDSFYNDLWQVVKKKKKTFEGKIVNRRKGGELYVAIGKISPILSDDKRLLGFVATEVDITNMQRMDKAKTEFVSLASHQLRTPLSAINWYTEMLLDGDAGKINSEQKQYLKEIYKGNQRMIGLVNSLLNASRLELGTFTVETKITNITSIAKSVIKELKVNVEKKKIKLNLKIDKNLPKIKVDPSLMRIIFQNLLSNAVKYTPIKGKVNVKLSKSSKYFKIEVSDTGMGIPKSQQDKIFTKLFRADNVKAADTEGTGLGLYIVKSILDTSGGSIKFNSQQSKGTTFIISLPLIGMKSKKGTKRIT